MSDPPDRDLARRDEVLELLFWLEGEGIGASDTPAEIARFLAEAEPDVRATLDDLVRRGEAVREGDPERFRLTERGRQEAARRFADTFAELTRQAHGACSDPECDCQTLGPEACAHAGH